MVGCTSHYLDVNHLKLSRGRFLSDADDDAYANVVVIANDYLRFQVQTAIAGKPVTLVRFPKSGGVSWLESEERKELRAAQIQSYFNSELLMCVRDTRLTADTSLTRGDLRVHAESVRIDGTLEARLRGALETVLNRSARA